MLFYIFDFLNFYCKFANLIVNKLIIHIFLAVISKIHFSTNTGITPSANSHKNVFT